MLTFSCFKRLPFLTKDRTRGYLAEAIEQAHSRHRFDVWAYVFMPEHVHQLLWPLENVSISDILLSVKQSVARRALLYVRKNEPEKLGIFATGRKHNPYMFWMNGSGYDRDIWNPTTLRAHVDYIHGNPVRRGLVQCPEERKWSSASEWMGLGKGPVTLKLEAFPH